MAEPPRLTAVVCGFYQQFINWCHDNGRNPRDPSLRLVLPGGEHKVQGYLFDDMVVVGEPPWHLRNAARARLRSEVMG